MVDNDKEIEMFDKLLEAADLLSSLIDNYTPETKQKLDNKLQEIRTETSRLKQLRENASLARANICPICYEYGHPEEAHMELL